MSSFYQHLLTFSSKLLLYDPMTGVEIVSYLDRVDLFALARTSRQVAFVCGRAFASGNFQRNYVQVLPGTTQPVTGPTFTAATNFALTSSSTSAATSPGNNDADYDTLSSTDTEMTSPDDAEEEFQMIEEVVKRLSELPEFISGPTLPGLPNELQIEIFNYLDKIDSACLGLTSRKGYMIFTAIHGTKMPLNTRRVGPNTLESCWEVVDKKDCNHCGPYRCELYQHIKSWMPNELEYCTFKQNFGSPAEEGANATCVRGKPSKPRRCGRHPVRTTTVHENDTQMTL